MLSQSTSAFPQTRYNLLVYSLSNLNNYPPIDVENGVVYADSQDQHVYAFRAADGNPIWQYNKLGASDHLLAVQNGIMYVQHGYGVYALQLQNPPGRVLWLFDSNDLHQTPDVTIADRWVYAFRNYWDK